MKRNVSQEYSLAHWDINGQVVFLQQAYRRKGFEIDVREINQLQEDGHFKFFENELSFKIGAKVMMCEGNVRNEIDKRYSYKQMNSWRSCQLVEITSIK